jgi:putative thiamine transport system ATP-binding protein
VNGLALRDVCIALPERVLVDDFSLDVRGGECVTVMGPSGCGKSTLLAFVAGTLGPPFTARGGIAVDGRELASLAPERRAIGILFQDDLLFPHMSVGGNLAFGLSPGVRERAERRRRVDEALAEAGLPGLADRDPATLSGGQRARAALMRALLSAPRALLLDEPFNKLDAALRAEFRAFVFDHAARRGLPVLLVTHDAADVPPGGRVVAIG